MIETDVQKLRDWLKEGLHTITFTKVDGTTRTMVGTLKPDLLPALPPLVEGQVLPPRKTPAPGVVNCYVPAELGWRSFKAESLILMKPVVEV
jgi:hypothetical protein